MINIDGNKDNENWIRIVFKNLKSLTHDKRNEKIEINLDLLQKGKT
jgi:phage-related protein